MKIAHLILAHKNPRQLARLIRQIIHPDCDIFIHLDGKSQTSEFAHLFSETERVFPIHKRTKVYWAGFGTIQATINGFEQLVNQGYDYVNVMSAQDFPLKPASHMYHFIKERKGTEFITCESIYDEWSEAASRIHKYSFVNLRLPGAHLMEKVTNKILAKRKFPMHHEVVGRANWFTLTNEAIVYSLNFIKAHPKLIWFYKLTWGADEFIFSTILYNSHFKSRIAPNLNYVDWTGMTGGHPRILVTKDFPKLVATPKLFARKFDMEADENIFDLLEAHIRKLEQSQPVLRQ